MELCTHKRFLLAIRYWVQQKYLKTIWSLVFENEKVFHTLEIIWSIKKFWINKKRIVNFGLIWMKTAEWLWIEIMFIFKINFCLSNLITRWQSRLSFYKIMLCYQIQFDQFQSKGLSYWNQRQKQNCYILMEIMLILIIKLKFGLE